MDCPPGFEVKAAVSPLTADGEGVAGVGVGLYATRKFAAGEVVLDEVPFFVADGRSGGVGGDGIRGGEQKEDDGDEPDAASSQFDVSDLDDACASYFGDDGAEKKGASSAENSGASSAPDDGPSSSSLADLAAMVRTAASFAALDGDTDGRRRVLGLYHPDPSRPTLPPEEEGAVRAARDALRFCRDRARRGSPLRRLLSSPAGGDGDGDGDGGGGSGEDQVLRAMLVWSCNAFEGGLLYETTSRVNHSCDPNCFYGPPPSSSSSSSPDDSPLVRDGDKGHRGRMDRHRQVVRALVPIEVGDEITVSYLGIFTWADGATRRGRLLRTKHFTCRCDRCCFRASSSGGSGKGTVAVDAASAVPCPSCHGRRIGGVLEEEVMWEEVPVSYACSTAAGDDGEEVTKCSKCNFVVAPDSREAVLAKKVIAKVTDCLLSSGATPDPSTTAPESLSDAMSADAEIDEQLYQMAASVVGAMHWTTNLMLLSLLDRSVAEYNAAMMLGRTPPMEDLADSIDSLERLWRYAGGLGLLGTDPAFLLHRQTLGVARSLVALGDVKSQRYGSEWAERIRPYVERFEGGGMKKVVHALQSAWKRNGGGDGGGGAGGANDGENEGEHEGDRAGDTHQTKKRKT